MNLSEDSLCPICNKPNHCQIYNEDGYKGPCWCMKEVIPQSVLDKVPEQFKKIRCVCKKCIDNE